MGTVVPDASHRYTRGPTTAPHNCNVEPAPDIEIAFHTWGSFSQNVGRWRSHIGPQSRCGGLMEMSHHARG